MTRLESLCACAVVAALSLGCSDDSGDPAEGGGAGGSGGADGPVSFAADIHPILVMKCSDQASQCHSSPNNGPFQPGHANVSATVAYAQTQMPSGGGEAIYERMLERVSAEGPLSMPPPYANPPCEGEIGTPGCLSEAELALLRAWVDQGAPP